MPQSIENSANCEIRSIFRFLNAKDVKAAEIHRQISEAYGENVMSEGMVRKWVKDGRRNVHDDERNGRPSAITEDLTQKVDGKVRENRRFTISSDEFPQVSRSVLHGIVTESLNYRAIGACLVPQDIRRPQNVFHLHLSAMPVNAAPVPDDITASVPDAITAPVPVGRIWDIIE
ncbi:hypothetical protein AVEN_193502-1 [Araneus ventricosus]|uniref:Mos1 transposase HTH domain-containing protein n=1 Tax=Araneus ventricosus TaxID=182803 RepID=A0A4Y2KLW8_ARAVE|nr:hypothetical protein AVEN_193502-1 [Araneus ventricosus]